MAIYDAKRLPRFIVIRPSGVWDSRAPFHTYLKVSKAQSRAHAVTTLCLERVGADLIAARDNGLPLEDFLVVKTRDRSRRAWRNYVSAQTDRNLDCVLKRPIYGNTRHDMLMAYETDKRHALLAAYALFETYITSWVLNHLLTVLEVGEREWTPQEHDLASALSPVHGSKNVPNAAFIIPHVHDLIVALRARSHDGAEMANEPPAFSLFDSVTFWRQYRNALVHNDGFCTPKLFAKQLPYWTGAMGAFGRDHFAEREPLPLSAELVQHCRSTMHRAARTLEATLEKESRGRRGHPWAPTARPSEQAPPPDGEGLMLLPGDHEISVAWSIDPQFREQYKATS